MTITTPAMTVAERWPAARPLRIAVFSYGLPCPGEKRGGIEQVAHDLSAALARRGHRITVFTYDPAPDHAPYEVRSLPARSFVTSWLGRRITMGYLGNLLAVLPGYRDFDLVIAHGDSLLLPLCGRPVLRIMHGNAMEEALSASSPWRTVLQTGVYVQELITALLQKGTVGVSHNARRLNPFIKTVIPNGVDLRACVPAIQKRTRHPSILFVGALTGRKRGAWLLDEFERNIRPDFPNAELRMVTTPGPSRAGVSYHPGISRERLISLYQESWVYASPSTYEGFGLPYLEALACGAAVVATPNPGSREVLDNGRYGRLAEDGDFAKVVCRLLQDPTAREGLSRCGVTRAAEFDIDRSAASYEAFINNLVLNA